MRNKFLIFPLILNVSVSFASHGLTEKDVEQNTNQNLVTHLQPSIAPDLVARKECEEKARKSARTAEMLLNNLILNKLPDIERVKIFKKVSKLYAQAACNTYSISDPQFDDLKKSIYISKALYYWKKARDISSK